MTIPALAWCRHFRSVSSIVRRARKTLTVLTPLSWVCVPWPHAANPYLGLLGAALQSLQCIPDARGAAALRAGASVLHVHWVWLNKDPIRNLLKRRELGALLETARELRRPLVWTMHNADPHDASSAERDFMRRVAQSANGIIVHSSASAEIARAQNPRAEVRVIPHGPLRDAYGPAPERADARRNMGLPEQTTLLCFGQLRPYRGVQELIIAFKKVRGALTLLITGACDNAELRKSLTELARGDERIVLITERVPDEHVPQLFAAADRVVLPYRAATTSGVANLALGFRRALLLPDVPSLTAGLPESVHVRIGAKEPLDEALLRALARAEPTDFPEQITWAEVAAAHRRFFDQLCI